MKNMIYTKGFINNSGDIEVPGVFLEEGAEVELKISVARGKFEIALSPQRTKYRSVTVESRRKRYSVPVPCTKTATGVRLMTTAERNRRWFHENTCV